jgi:hypothetical protein
MRRLVSNAIGVAIILLLLGVWSAARGPGDERGVIVPTTYSSGPAGARGLYLLLEEMHFSVSRSRSADLGEAPADAVLWTLADVPLDVTAAHELAQRVEQGGTVVLPAEPAEALFAALGVEGMKTEMVSGVIKAHDCELDPKHELERRGASTLVGLDAPTRIWATIDNRPVVAEWAQGKGRVVLFEPVDLLTNRGLRELPIAELAFTVARDLGPRHVFDESRTGFGEASAWTMVRSAPWRFGLIQLLLALLVTVSVLALRSMPLMTLPVPHRRETREHVEAVAALWRRHGDAGLPLSSLMRALELRSTHAGVKAGADPTFVAWVRWRAASRTEEARLLWTRATVLAAHGRPPVGEIIAVAAQLRALEKEVFRAG